MLLLWLVDKAIQADNADQTQYKKIQDPEAEIISAIPRCETDVYYRKGDKCYDFLYSPAGNPAVEEIVTAMRQGSAIPADKVLGFSSKDDTDTWLAGNTETTNGAVHFYVNGSDISFVLQTNSTVKYFKGDFQNVNTKFQLPLQLAAHKATTSYLLQQDGQSVTQGDVAMSDFAHPAESTLSVVSAAGGPFIYAACMFGFIVQLSNVVMERETGLKQSLRTMGMMDSAYNASWAVWELAMALAASLVVIVSGYIFQFKMFLDNNFFVSFFLVFLFQVAMSALAFLFSPLVKKSFQAVYLGFTVFLLGWLMQIVIVFGIPYKPSYENNYLYVIFSLFPWTTFYKGILDLGEMTGAANDQGISWSSRSSYCKKEKESDFASGCSSQDSICECVMPLGEIYTVLIGLYFFYMILALYLDQVIANGGVGNPPWFFLLPGYWFSSRVATPKQGKAGSEGVSEITLKPMKVTGLDDFEVPVGTEHGASEQGKLTVQQEKERMQAKLEVRDSGKHVVRKVHSVGSAEHAEAGSRDDLSVLEVYGLQKVFTGGSCASRKKDFWAIRGSWFGIEEGTIFCLLGPNGAGKTTTINCLTGMMKPTGGDAVICGAALTAPAALEHIRARMGVCPQFDILWGELSGQEHLEVFAWVKGIDRHEIASVVKSSLEQVNLTNSRHARTSTYSGGMKRRLSVALALLGNPRIVYLDEPTTGMDPISRRAVWDIIEASKKGRAIVLTTHSMEEADILGDRIGIMAKGSLRVVGTSIALKRIYGSGYQITINLNQRGQGPSSAAEQQNAEAVKAIFQEKLHMAPVEERPGFLTYLVPHEKQAELANVLALLASQREQLGIRDPQVAMSSLEEVFLSIARQAEMEAATAAGAKTVPFTDADGKVMEVPLGVDTIINPHTNQVCKVIWGQDDVGALQVFSVVPVENAAPPMQN